MDLLLRKERGVSGVAQQFSLGFVPLTRFQTFFLFFPVLGFLFCFFQLSNFFFFGSCFRIFVLFFPVVLFLCFPVKTRKRLGPLFAVLPLQSHVFPVLGNTECSGIFLFLPDFFSFSQKPATLCGTATRRRRRCVVEQPPGPIRDERQRDTTRTGATNGPKESDKTKKQPIGFITRVYFVL